MAEPGDPKAPEDDHDDLIGFASPASLEGRRRAPEPVPEAAPEPAPDLFSASMAAEIPVEPEPSAPAPQPEPPITPAMAPPAAPEPRPVDAASVFEPAAAPVRRRREPPPEPPVGGMSLYAVYALILFAVPTAGVSAVIGLLAVTGRPGPDDALSRSHFIYQQRTLWTAAVAVGVGLIFFLAPFGLGPGIMFLAALWLVVRGASGVWTLKAGRPIADPRGWWI